jgi:uncharacterized heparinase superfamily protein
LIAATDVRSQIEPRIDSLLRYLHTLQYLRPIQIIGRVRLGLHHPKPDMRPAPARRPLSHEYEVAVEGTPALIASERLRFLNVEGSCAAPSDWQPQGADKLWSYNLHYFDDLSARGAEARGSWHRPLLERWVAENPPGEGVGWEPFPLSRRIVNWVKWSMRGGELPASCLSSLAVQARWLRGRLEYHLLGNHLLANAKALVHAGLYFAGPEAERWYSHGMRLMASELREQILPDGGHFERSPMYHAVVLEDLLDLINVLRAYARTPPDEWLEVVAAMRRWLKVMTHPDGEIAFFNDAAFQVAPTSAALEAFAGRLGLDPSREPAEVLVTLAPSGYIRARLGPAYLLCDCAPVGPDHQPGHAHADTLSFELSLEGLRVFVNSGTSRYTWDAERQWQRGTAAHNTVVVDGQNSSEVWAAFRVARRARAHLQTARATTREAVIAGSHDGYRRLRGHNQHSREWRLDERSLSIADQVSGAFGSAAAHFHVHPEVEVRLISASVVELVPAAGARVRMSFEGAGAVEVNPSFWYPEFGLAVANKSVVATFAGESLTTRVVWA